VVRYVFRHDCRSVSCVLKINLGRHVSRLTRFPSLKDLLKLRLIRQQLPPSVLGTRQLEIPIILISLSQIIISVQYGLLPISHKLPFELVALQY